jgi:hypothetical protein
VNVRWRCETCGRGINAPQRMRRDDIRRFCLPCSTTAGRLVARTNVRAASQDEARRARAAVTAQRRREERAERRAAQAPVRFVERQARAILDDGLPVASEAERIWRILTKYHGASGPVPRVRRPKVHIYKRADGALLAYSRQGGSYAYAGRGYISLRIGADWETLAHELVHMADRRLRTPWLVDERRRPHDEWFYKTLRDVCQRRWKVDISFAEVTRYGYEVDRIIAPQIAGAIRAEVERRAARQAS